MDILKYAVENDIINLDDIRAKIEMNERTKYLNMHKQKVWKGNNNKWYTYVYEDSERRLIKKSSKKDLEDEIVNHYKTIEFCPRVKDVFYEWINSKLNYGEIQKQTYDRYEIDFKRYFVGEPIERMRIKNITEDYLEDFIKTSIHGKELTAKAWGGLRLLIRGIFKYSKKKNYSDISVTTFMGDLELSSKSFKRRIKKDRESVFTDDEIKMIMEYVLNNPSVHDYGIALALLTGLRVGELSTLKYSDITGHILTVSRSEIAYKDSKGKKIFDVRDSAKTEAGNREVIISDEAISIIQKIRRLNPFGEYIFMKNDKRIKGVAFTKKMYTICKKLGIPHRSMHNARKTYATKLINAGVDEKLVINQLGHTDIMTTKHYYYFNNRSEAEAIEQISMALR